MENTKGTVYLVGAGPSDDGLLTVKAKQILEKAEVVVYDRLVGPRILSLLPDSAEKINVGKNVGNHPVPQEEINYILLNKALEGKLVVRLKGGDPFVFGRGGEELELLSQHQVPFVVIPGITSAIAAATYAGIPVTHRDFCSSLHIITGHAKKGGDLNIDYASLVKLEGTLVFMMSVAAVGEIADGLMNAGMGGDTKVAVIENATRPNQRKFVSQLDNIASVIVENNVISPATIIVGKVCTLSHRFDWFSNLPLKGCNVLITRPKQTTGKLSQMLWELGAEAVEYPCIRTSIVDFDLNINNLRWIIFTSAVGVKAFYDKFFEKKMDSRCLHDKKIAVIGSETASELLKYGIRADFIPSVFDAEHLATELLNSGQISSKDQVGVFRAKIGTEDLVRILRDNNVEVSDVAVYETNYVKNHKIDMNKFEYVTFTSASCVQGFVGSFGEDTDFSSVNAVCIGKQTASIAKQYGMKTIISDIATISGIVAKIKEIYNGK